MSCEVKKIAKTKVYRGRIHTDSAFSQILRVGKTPGVVIKIRITASQDKRGEML